MAVWDRWFTSWLDSHGYARKADVSRARLVSTIWEGETGGFSTSVDTSEWTADQWTQYAINCAIVGRDVGQLARMGMDIPMAMYTGWGDDRENIPDHPFIDVWRHVNDYWDSRLLLHYTYWWYYLRGEAYWLLVPQASGQLAEIWPIPANRIQPIPDARKYIAGYSYTSKKNGQSYTLAPQYVCFFRHGPHLYKYHRGMSWLSHYMYELKADREMIKWQAESYQKGLTLDAILSVPAETSEIEYLKAKADIKEAVDIEGRRWIITRAGDLSVDTVGLSAKDAEYLGSMSMTEHRIDGVYGFPDGYWSVMGNRANTEGARATVIENTVQPVANLFSGTITDQIIHPYYGKEVHAAFDDVRPRDRALQVRERSVYWQVKTVNEARAELDLEPLEDEELGEKLVPLAMKGSGGGGGTPFGGGGVGQIGDLEPGSQEDEEQELDTKAIRDDLRRWKSIAVRRLREGNDPGGYEFESDVIPLGAMIGIKAALAEASTEEEVKASFDAGFCANHSWSEAGHNHGRFDWAGYP